MSPAKSKRPPKGQPHFEALPSLLQICVAMGSTFDLRTLLRLILRLTMEELSAQQGSILLFERESDQLRMLASRGMPRAITRRGYIPRRGSIAEWVIEHDKPLLLNDVKKSDRRFTSIAKGRTIHSSMCVPLRAKDKVVGTINITRTQRREFSEEDLDTLVVLAAQAAVSIENARLYEENLQAERLAAIGRTVAAISHCSRNMLTGLKGGASMIDMGCEQKEWELVRQGWDMVRRNTGRIELMVFDMLQYSRERTPTRTVFPLDRLFDEVFSGVAYSAEQAGVRLISRIDPACQTICADFNQLYRALLNLVTNAIDAIRESPGDGGEIEMRAERVDAGSPIVRRCLAGASGRFDVIHVRDNGIGIPSEYVPSLFQPFFSRKGSKGTGLGLAVTRKIALEHGGEVTVESEPGRGTVFSLILPVVKPPQQPACPES